MKFIRTLKDTYNRRTAAIEAQANALNVLSDTLKEHIAAIRGQQTTIEDVARSTKFLARSERASLERAGHRVPEV